MRSNSLWYSALGDDKLKYNSRKIAKKAPEAHSVMLTTWWWYATQNPSAITEMNELTVFKSGFSNRWQDETCVSPKKNRLRRDGRFSHRFHFSRIFNYFRLRFATLAARCGGIVFDTHALCYSKALCWYSFSSAPNPLAWILVSEFDFAQFGWSVGQHSCNSITIVSFVQLSYVEPFDLSEIIIFTRMSGALPNYQMNSCGKCCGNSCEWFRNSCVRYLK